MDKNPQNSAWTWRRTLENDENNLYSRLRQYIALITVLSVLSSIVAVLRHWGAGWVMTFLLIGCAGVLWEDLTTIPGHFISYQVRKLMAVLIISWVIPIWYSNEDLLMVLTIITIALVPMGMIVNKRMLYSDTWRYSASVQHGLNMSPNSEAEKEWSRWGCAEATSLYGYSGNDPNRAIVERYAKPIFFMTYAKIRNRFCTEIDALEVTKRSLYEAEEQIERLEAELEAAEQRAYELISEEDDSELFTHIIRDRDHMAEMCAKLQLANDELVEALNNQEPIIEHVPDERYLYLSEEDRVIELLNRNKSYREIEAITGVSKSKVGKIAKKLEDNYEQSE